VPTLCIQVPTFETICPVQIRRKLRCRKAEKRALEGAISAIVYSCGALLFNCRSILKPPLIYWVGLKLSVGFTCDLWQVVSVYFSPYCPDLSGQRIHLPGGRQPALHSHPGFAPGPFPAQRSRSGPGSRNGPGRAWRNVAGHLFSGARCVHEAGPGRGIQAGWLFVNVSET